MKIYSVEGNIGSVKSTLLKKLNFPYSIIILLVQINKIKGKIHNPLRSANDDEDFNIVLFIFICIIIIIIIIIIIT
jgi:hypothetical protein